MPFDSKGLDDYVDVAERVADFREQYPEGSLRPWNPAEPWKLVQAQGWEKNGEIVTQSFVVVIAAAYRHPFDESPGVGMAWEIFPGRTPYTRGSELQNAETSAWGRAVIAALAGDSRRGIASRQEVRNRRAEDGLPLNADGSLSRSQTSDEQKQAAGVMTSGQQRAHAALRPKPAEMRAGKAAAAQVEDVWTGQPAGELPGLEPELREGSVSNSQKMTLVKLAAENGMSTPEHRHELFGELLGLQGPVETRRLSYMQADSIIRILRNRNTE